MKKILLTIAIAALASTQLFAQIGTRFPSERKVVIDPVTGTELIFLTSTEGKGDSKIYQTHNQWTSDGEWLIFRSRRVPGEAMAVNEETGVMVQVTEGGYSGMLNVSRKEMKLYVCRPDMTPEQKAEQEALRAQGQTKLPQYGMKIVEIDLAKVFADSAAGTMKDVSAYERVCGVTPVEMGAGSNMALDGSEQVAYFNISTEYASKFPYPAGVKFPKIDANTRGARVSGIAKMDLNTGKCEHVVTVPFSVGHIQGNPWQPGEVMFCWETGGKAPIRTWMVNADGSNLRPVYRETAHDWVTHEAVITKDEMAIAILGHREISEDQKPVDRSGDRLNPGQEDRWGYTGTREYAGGLGIVNLRTREFTMAGQIPFGSGFWHVAGSEDGHWVAGDDFARNIYLIDRHTCERILLTTGHKPTAGDHPHPTFKPDGTAIEIQSAMLSEDGRSLNICVIKMPQELLDRYKK